MDQKSPILIKPFGQLTAAELHRITRAREAVFFLEQQVTAPDADDVDPQSVFVWIEHEGHVVAFLRIIPAGIVYAEASMGRLLVAAPHRGKHLSQQLILAALNYISSTWGPQPIRVSARTYLTDYYQTLGFEVVSDQYFEAGLPHIKMLRR